MAQAPGHGIIDKQGGGKRGGRGGSGGTGGGGNPSLDRTGDLLAEYGDPGDPTTYPDGTLPPDTPPPEEDELAMNMLSKPAVPQKYGPTDLGAPLWSGENTGIEEPELERGPEPAQAGPPA